MIVAEFVVPNYETFRLAAEPEHWALFFAFEDHRPIVELFSVPFPKEPLYPMGL